MFKILFSIVPYAFALTAMLLFVLPCRLKVRVQAIWAMVLLFCASKFLCFAQFGGDAFAPELPEKFIWFWNWAYSGMCILLVLCLPGLLIRNRRVRVWVVPLMAWALALWGVANGLKVPDVREETVFFPNLPVSLEGYRVLQLSDLHVSSAARRWRTQAIVEKANAAEADLICLTGDYVDGMPSHQTRNLEPLKELKAKDGVVAVTGEHEFYFDFDRYQAMYRSWGIPVLNGDCLSPRAGLAVGGVGDPVGLSYGVPLPTYETTFATATNGEFRLRAPLIFSWPDIRMAGLLPVSARWSPGITSDSCADSTGRRRDGSFTCLRVPDSGPAFPFVFSTILKSSCSS